MKPLNIYQIRTIYICVFLDGDKLIIEDDEIFLQAKWDSVFRVLDKITKWRGLKIASVREVLKTDETAEI